MVISLLMVGRFIIRLRISGLFVWLRRRRRSRSGWTLLFVSGSSARVSGWVFFWFFKEWWVWGFVWDFWGVGWFFLD